MRVGSGAALVAAEQRALHEAAAAPNRRLRAAAERRASGGDRAGLHRVDAAELAAAMSTSPEQRSPELRQRVSRYSSQRVVNSFSRSQWSKHGKRI